MNTTTQTDLFRSVSFSAPAPALGKVLPFPAPAPAPVATPALPPAASAPQMPAPGPDLPGLIRIDVIRDRDYTRYGHRYEGRVEKDAHAEILPGKWIRIFGLDSNVYGPPRPFDLTFKVGDTAETGSYNLTYLGTITSIGASTVSVKGNVQSVRWNLCQFVGRHKDFDLDKIEASNAAWMD